MKILCAIILLIVAGCAANGAISPPKNTSIPKILIVPTETFDAFIKRTDLTVGEAREFEMDYSRDYSEKLLSEISELNDHNYFVCGLTWQEPPENMESMRLVGITEKWIPINGKPTKILHFKLKK